MGCSSSKTTADASALKHVHDHTHDQAPEDNAAPSTMAVVEESKPEVEIEVSKPDELNSLPENELEVIDTNKLETDDAQLEESTENLTDDKDNDHEISSKHDENEKTDPEKSDDGAGDDAQDGGTVEIEQIEA